VPRPSPGSRPHSAILPALLLLAAAAVPGAETIHIKAISGMQYDLTQFAVKPGEQVTVELENADTTDMPHNLVITKPGRREAVVNASLLLGADGPKLGYVPASPDVLWSIPVVMANETKSVAFTAPKDAGIYPYVCCFPGHGLIMFGAMYVGVEMPAAKPKDSEDGGGAATADDGKSPHAFPLQRPMLYRAFMPGASPAAIAVALPGDENYCWDAGQCRFRYAWSGGFINNNAYWKGNGNGVAKLLGAIWYTAPKGQPLRLARESDPATAFKGYQLLKGLPEFRYTIDGIEVRELIRPAASGHGLEFAFQVASDAALFYRVDPEHAAWFSSPAGSFAQGVLAIPAKAGRSFTVTLTAPAASQP
jgi:azurin